MKYILLLATLCSSAYLATATTEVKKNNVYGEIAKIVLESENSEEQNTFAFDSKATALDKANALLRLAPDAELKKTVFKLFEIADSRSFASIMEPYSLREINILAGDAEDKNLHLLNTVDRTQTLIGRASLARLLAEPTTSQEIITKRQQALKLFIKDENNPTLTTDAFISFHKLIKKMSKHEKNLLTNWHAQANIDSELANQIYYPAGAMEKLNSSKTTLEYGRKLKLALTGVSMTMNGIILAATAGYGIMTGARFLAGNIPSDEAVKTGAFTTLYSGLIGYSLYQIKKQIEVQHHISVSLYKRVYPIAQIFKSINLLYSNLKRQENVSLLAVTENANSLKDFCENNVSENMKSLKEILFSDTFAENNSSWTNRLGDAAAAYTLLQQVKDELIPVLVAIGSIDAYLSIAEVFATSAGSSDQFTFVEFIDEKQPILDLTGLHNPLVRQAVPSNITFGGSNTNNLIITGPHGGGKSTYMKAISYAIVLAQSFGIAPAVKAKMTIFDKLNTYCNIKEQLGQGHSTFMAEKKRIDDITSTIKALSDEEKAFSLIDEPLKGTMEVEGALRVTNFLKTIAPYAQSILVIATHFAQPASLAQDLSTRFNSAYPELIETEYDFIRTFKILPGCNEWWFNDAEKRERYINWLTQQ